MRDTDQPTKVFEFCEVHLATLKLAKMNAGICVPQTTDHDPVSVIPGKKRKYVTTFFADLLFFFGFKYQIKKVP